MPKAWERFVAAGLLAGAAGLLALVLASAHAAAPAAPVAPGALPPTSFANPEEAIVARKEAMKTDGKIFKAMKAALAAGQDPGPFTADAQWLVAWGKQMPLMFPKGSETGHDTKAKPAIWTDKPGFDRDAANMVAASEKLVQAAESNDKAAFAAGFQAVGKSCGGCHKAYAYPLH